MFDFDEDDEPLESDQENCDHDWEDMGEYEECTYPECQLRRDKVK